ncbi:MAG: ATP-binding protein [Bergeyella sp.]
MVEGKTLDKKSLKFLKGKNTNWNELAKDCVAFANNIGGFILIGIEDNNTLPPTNQKIIKTDIIDEIHKNVLQRTVNVGISITVETAENNSQYIKIQVFRSIQTIASTTDGKYYIRIDDQCKPIPPDEMGRLAADKNAFVWEEQTSKKISKQNADIIKRANFLREIRTSNRVSGFVKEMSDDELLEHFLLQKDSYLTNLGILWIGKRNDRATLLYAPTVQIIRYNGQDEKVWKLVFDDFFQNPKELIELIEKDVPDWQETMEFSDGLFRKNIPFFPIEIVRELLVNAFAHRTYTTRGDIFINIFPNRLEIHSPGKLPYGVTSQNILSQCTRRNEHIAKIFYSLNLMEREGSGYDLIYEILLGSGKQIPNVVETNDRVIVTVMKQFINKEIVRLMDKASKEFQLKQKEIISLGLIAQNQSLSSSEISKILNQTEEQGLKNWLGKLLDYDLIIKSGKSKGTQYSINPDFVKKIDFKNVKTNLKNIEDYRLEELIYKDINSYPNSSFGEIHKRIGEEINIFKVRRIIKNMLDSGKINKWGTKKWTKYFIK